MDCFHQNVQKKGFELTKLQTQILLWLLLKSLYGIHAFWVYQNIDGTLSQGSEEHLL